MPVSSVLATAAALGNTDVAERLALRRKSERRPSRILMRSIRRYTGKLVDLAMQSPGAQRLSSLDRRCWRSNSRATHSGCMHVLLMILIN